MRSRCAHQKHATNAIHTWAVKIVFSILYRAVVVRSAKKQKGCWSVADSTTVLPISDQCQNRIAFLLNNEKVVLLSSMTQKTRQALHALGNSYLKVYQRFSGICNGGCTEYPRTQVQCYSSEILYMFHGLHTGATSQFHNLAHSICVLEAKKGGKLHRVEK